MSDPCYQTIVDAFQGLEEKPYLETHDRAITLSGGFMQGILHFTSSVFHSAVQVHSKRFAKSFFRESREVQLIWDHQTSSDDSGVIATLVGDVRPKHIRYLELLCFAKWEIGRSVAITTSVEKSTPLTSKVYEFNSDFHSASTVLQPTIKYLFAQLQISGEDSLLGRQEQYASMRTSLLEGGGTVLLCAISNVCQGLLHYTSWKFRQSNVRRIH